MRYTNPRTHSLYQPAGCQAVESQSEQQDQTANNQVDVGHLGRRLRRAELICCHQAREELPRCGNPYELHQQPQSGDKHQLPAQPTDS